MRLRPEEHDLAPQLADDASPSRGGALVDHPTGVSVAEVWRALRQQSFAVVAYATPEGEPRSSGVVYGVHDGHLYVAVAPDSWKARHIATSRRVAVTVPVRRGGLLSFLFPIPPATISFHGSAAVLPPDSDRARAALSGLHSLLPPERRTRAVLLEMTPEDVFVTYGVGVTLSQMRHPQLARARIPVSPG